MPEKKEIAITDEQLTAVCRELPKYYKVLILAGKVRVEDLTSLELAEIYNHVTAEGMAKDDPYLIPIRDELLRRLPAQEPTPHLWTLVYRLCPDVEPGKG